MIRYIRSWTNRLAVISSVGCSLCTIAMLFVLFKRVTEHDLLFWTGVGAGVVLFVLIFSGTPVAIYSVRQNRALAQRSAEVRRQVEQLFKMTDMLQSAMDYGDANAVLRATATKLLPGFGGMLHVFNNSRDRLDLSVAWKHSASGEPPASISPNSCWALKRGKLHLNLDGEDDLRCEHHTSDHAALEIPMMARGEVYGLLTVMADGDGAEKRLEEIASLAGALADAMSLALSNIALRDKLRTQALRDPLTGLYNRRYMEDVLERFVNLAERNGSSVSAIMIDLDHFKRLNDEHGHAMGDAVLREVAGAIVGSIRPSDVACRYGGEELLVLLPDCAADEASVKAELLRTRIERLSEIHGIQISASLGVASASGTGGRAVEIISAADNALYRAKRGGRNRVEFARPDPSWSPEVVAAE